MLAYGESGRSEYHHGFYFVRRTAMLASIEQRLAGELAVSVHQVQAAIALMDEGATVPFIARYRKEATGGLDDVQLRPVAGAPRVSPRTRAASCSHYRID